LRGGVSREIGFLLLFFFFFFGRDEESRKKKKKEKNSKSCPFNSTPLSHSIILIFSQTKGIKNPLQFLIFNFDFDFN